MSQQTNTPNTPNLNPKLATPEIKKPDAVKTGASDTTMAPTAANQPGAPISKAV